MLDRLLRITGNAQFGNMMERSIYNALFAAQSPDGRNIRYFTPLEGPREYFRDTYCCPNNFRRILAELPGMVCYRSGGGVAVNLYTQSIAKIDLGRRPQRYDPQQETDYPTSGLVKLTVTPSAAMEFPLRLRIPGWCEKAKLTVSGEPPREVAPGKEFLELRHTWKPGDVVTLDMPMPWRFVRGRKLQEGYVALMRGPVLYCLGTGQNAELLKKHPLGELVLDLASVAAPVADASIRPNGLKVVAKAWPSGSPGQGAVPVDIVLTEFADPSGIATYFRVQSATPVVDDELSSPSKNNVEKVAVGGSRWLATPLILQPPASAGGLLHDYP